MQESSARSAPMGPLQTRKAHLPARHAGLAASTKACALLCGMQNAGNQHAQRVGIWMQIQGCVPCVPGVTSMFQMLVSSVQRTCSVTPRTIPRYARISEFLRGAMPLSQCHQVLQVEYPPLFHFSLFFLSIITHGTRAGSYHPSQCSCSLAGGFEGGSATGLVGCTPCLDGFYSQAGMPECLKCPNGTYSSRSTNLRNFYKCPNATSPRLPVVAETDCTTKMEAGAVSCTPCPQDRPYTLKDGSTSISYCRTCPVEHYLDAVTKKCTRCRSSCASPSYYESVACTQTTNRQCSLCNRVCSSVEEYQLPLEVCFLLLHASVASHKMY